MVFVVKEFVITKFKYRYSESASFINLISENRLNRILKILQKSEVFDVCWEPGAVISPQLIKKKVILFINGNGFYRRAGTRVRELGWDA